MTAPRGGGCGRARCPRPRVADHDFCGPCLRWLRDDSVADPLAADLPTVSAFNPEPVDEIVGWVATFVTS